MARQRGREVKSPNSGGEDPELTDEELQQQTEQRRKAAMESPFSQETDQNYLTDAEANDGATEPEPELVVTASGKDGAEPVRENRREKRLREERERGPLARYKFRIMVGASIGQDYEEPIIVDTTTGKPRADRRRPSKMFKTGEIQWSNHDLAKKHNRPGSIKYRLVEDFGEKAYTDGIDPNKHDPKVRVGGRDVQYNDEPPVELPKKSDLEAMSYGDLRQYAAEQEYDLSGCHSKEDVIKAIIKEQKKAQRG